jgi:hypothetical protein
MTTQIIKGDFINVASTPKFIPFVGQINSFWLKNLTRSGITSQGVSGSLTSDRIVEAYFNPNTMANGKALINQNGTVAGILAPMQTGICAINGCTIVNGGVYSQGASFSILSFATGSTTTFTTATNHGFQVGDNVRIVSLASAPQMGGLVMTVTATNGTNTFTTLFDSTNAVTSTGTVYKVGNSAFMNQSLYYPQNRSIASVSLANPMVVKTLVQQNYQVGDKVRFQIPTVFGMQQLNSTSSGLPVEFTVSAVNNAVGTQSVTFSNTDSSAFTAFAWAAAASYPYGSPVMIPQGEGNLNNLTGITPSPLPYANQDILGFATQNLGQSGILIGAGDGTNSATTGGIIGSTADAWEYEFTTALQTFY